MSQEIKSALELAMEKLDREGVSVQQLTSDQKEEIAEIRKRYQARIAQEEIAIQSRLAAAISEGKGEQVSELQARFARERDRLNSEMEKAVEKVKAKE